MVRSFMSKILTTLSLRLFNEEKLSPYQGNFKLDFKQKSKHIYNTCASANPTNHKTWISDNFWYTGKKHATRYQTKGSPDPVSLTWSFLHFWCSNEFKHEISEKKSFLIGSPCWKINWGGCHLGFLICTKNENNFVFSDIKWLFIYCLGSDQVCIFREKKTYSI